MNIILLYCSLIEVVPKLGPQIHLFDPNREISSRVREELMKRYSPDLYDLTENCDSLAFSLKNRQQDEFYSIIPAACNLLALEIPRDASKILKGFNGAASDAINEVRNSLSSYLHGHRFRSSFELWTDSHRNPISIETINHGIVFGSLESSLEADLPVGEHKKLTKALQKELEGHPLGGMVHAVVF